MLKNKIFPIIISMAIFTSIFPIIGFSGYNKASDFPFIEIKEQFINPITNILPPDQIDQQSTKDDESRLITTHHLAQSFKPSFPILTRVELLLTKIGGDAMYIFYNLEIRKDNLESSAVTQINIQRKFF